MFCKSVLITMLALTYLTAAVEKGSQGDGPSDDAPCKSYASCGPLGLHNWNILQTTLLQPNPQDRTDGPAKFQMYYAVQLSRVPYFAGPLLQRDLVDHGFDPTLLTSWETIARTGPNGAPDPFAAAYHNGFDTKNGLLIAYSNNRAMDTQKRLPWSELMYNTYKAISTQQKGGPISNLKTIIRQGVTTPGTVAVLRAMYNGRQLPTDQQTWYQWTEDDQRDFFFALLGTDNVSGVLMLLNYHAAELGKKEITEIWTRWSQPANPDIWIEIRPATWMNDVNAAAAQS